MKRALIRGGAALLCGVLMCSGVLWSLVTSFGLPIESNWSVILPCLLFPLVFAFLYSWKKGGWAVLLCFLLTALWCWWKRVLVLDSLLAFVSPIWDSYGEAYTLPIFPFLPASGNASTALALLAMLLAETTVCTVSRRETMWGALILSHLFLIVCLIPVFTPPAWWAFLLVIFCDVLLLITEQHRRMDSPDSERMILLAAIPLLIFLGLVCLLRNPTKPNEGTELVSVSDFVDSLEEKLLQWGEGVEGADSGSVESGGSGENSGFIADPDEILPDTAGTYGWNSSLSYSDLSRLGDRTLRKTEVMTVTSDHSGYLYLRGACFSVYEDNAWTVLPEEEYAAFSLPEDVLLGSGAVGTRTVKIQTSEPCSVVYLPYYPLEAPAGTVSYYDAWLKNSSGLSEYTILYSPSATAGVGNGKAWRSYTEFVYDTCLRLPGDTIEALAGVTAEIQSQVGSNGSNADYAQAVRSYVTSRAVYSLDVDRMPEGADFAAWFLTEADRGYCVHFAASAAVLLRSCGVPARYVVGYLAETEAGESAVVTEAQAHAWIEYYDDELGWVPLEVTPANGVDATAEGRKPTEEAPETEPAEPETPDSPTDPESGSTETPSTENPETTENSGSTEAGSGTDTPEKPGSTESSAPQKPSGGTPDNSSGSEPSGMITTPGKEDDSEEGTVDITTGSTEEEAAHVSPAAVIIFVLLLIPLLWNILLRTIRRVRFTKGSASARLLTHYRWIEAYCRLGKFPMPGEAQSLALRARFSNHKLTAEELGRIQALYEDARKDLTETSPILKRIALFLLLAI